MSEGEITKTPHRCPACRELTVYQSYSGGREWYCLACKSDGLYPEGSAPPRVQLLADGKYDELRQEMRAELAKRHAAAGVEGGEDQSNG